MEKPFEAMRTVAFKVILDCQFGGRLVESEVPAMNNAALFQTLITRVFRFECVGGVRCIPPADCNFSCVRHLEQMIRTEGIDLLAVDANRVVVCRGAESIPPF